MYIFGFDLPLAAVIGIGIGLLLALLLIIGLFVACCCCIAHWASNRRHEEVAPLPVAPYPRKASTPIKTIPASQYPRGASLANQQSHGGSWNRGAPQTEMLPAKLVPPPPPPKAQQALAKPLPPHARGNGNGFLEERTPSKTAKWEEDLRAGLFRKVPLAEVRSATGGFNKRNFLGEGAFAVVYRGRGPSGVLWAVKRSKRALAEGSAGALDFENEVAMISRLSHKNLVRLLGYCTEGGEHILVYEFAENGSLGSALAKSRPHMTFHQRLDIALGTAEALHYLHNAASPPIVHRDIKPDNILLDRHMNAKVGDFGLLKNIMEGAQQESVYTRVAGTPGYLDPEYHLTSKVTVKGDVYSFGVVLLELFTGRRAIISSDNTQSTGDSAGPASMTSQSQVSRKGGEGETLAPVHISQWAQEKVKSGDVEQLADSRLGDDYDLEVLLALVEIGLQCMRSPSRARPDMGGVVRALVEVKEALQQREEEGAGGASGLRSSGFDGEGHEPLSMMEGALSRLGSRRQESGSLPGGDRSPALGDSGRPSFRRSGSESGGLGGGDLGSGRSPMGSRSTSLKRREGRGIPEEAEDREVRVPLSGGGMQQGRPHHTIDLEEEGEHLHSVVEPRRNEVSGIFPI